MPTPCLTFFIGTGSSEGGAPSSGGFNGSSSNCPSAARGHQGGAPDTFSALLKFLEGRERRAGSGREGYQLLRRMDDSDEFRLVLCTVGHSNIRGAPQIFSPHPLVFPPPIVHPQQCVQAWSFWSDTKGEMPIDGRKSCDPHRRRRPPATRSVPTWAPEAAPLLLPRFPFGPLAKSRK